MDALEGLDRVTGPGDARRRLRFNSARLERELSAETRLAILWSKGVWHRHRSYPGIVGGVEIYDALHFPRSRGAVTAVVQLVTARRATKILVDSRATDERSF